MPWSAQDMTAKGAKDGAKAARIANAVLRRCLEAASTDRQRKNCEASAIRIALARTNRG